MIKVPRMGPVFSLVVIGLELVRSGPIPVKRMPSIELSTEWCLNNPDCSRNTGSLNSWILMGSPV